MTGRIARVDLTRAQARTDPLDPAWRRALLGGRGVNMLLLARAVLQQGGPADPLHPATPCIVGAGLLTGLDCPSASRTSISGLSPESGLLADSNLGGRFGARLRRAGLDHLVVIGRAPKPVYLLVENGGVTIHDAAGVWGLDCIQAEEELRRRHGKTARALTIGPAGENLARLACVRHGKKSAAGRGGLGCLMGAKNLKAVVAVGDAPPPVADPQGLAELTRRFNQRLTSTRTREVLHDRGTAFLFDLHSHAGIVRVKNGLACRFKEGRGLRSASLKKYYTGKRACFGCAIACRHTYRVRAGDAVVQGVGPEYGTLGNFGPVLGITDPEAVLLLNDRLNRLGLDSSATGNLIAWAMECYQDGLVTPADTGGLDLSWGNAAAVQELVEQIARAEGFGAVLAAGAAEAARQVGGDSARRLQWVKGTLQSDSVDLRSHKGFALGVATSTRGADHLRSRPTTEALSMTAEQLAAFYGAPVAADPTSYQGKARMVWHSELEYALADALGICRFAQRFNSPEHLNPEELRQLACLATDMDMDFAEFWAVGERILTLERHLLASLGVGRAHDTLPERCFTPVPEGPRKGERIEPERLQQMLDEYYDLHGWERDTAAPSAQRLAELGLDGLME